MPSPTPDPRWVRAVDLAVEVLLVGFAVFTGVHLLGAEVGWGVRTTGLLWLMVAAPVMVGAAWWGWRAGGPPAEAGAGRTRPENPVAATVFVVLSAVAAVGCAVAGAAGFTVSWALALLLAAASVVVWTRRARPPQDAPPDEAVPGAVPAAAAVWPHVVALLVAVGVGVFVLFVLNPSQDDVYYLNRAAWVAEQGTFPDRDTMFGPQTFPATYGAGLPIAALEEAYGSLARLFGVSAAGLAYLVANPLLAALSVWSTWRLVRSWATRRAVLALVVAVAVPLFAGSGLLGEFGYAREWQGKVVVLLLVTPLVWAHLTSLARGAPPAWPVAMLAVLGTAWCGLTVTAPVFAGVLAGAGLLTALLLPGARRPVGLGALALLAAPLLTGLATVLAGTEPVAEVNYVAAPAEAWARVLGEDRAVVALLGLALLVGPLLVWDRPGRLLAAVGSLLTLAVLVPGLFDLLDALTGTGPIAVRLLLTAPLPVLAGLLVTVPLPAAAAARLPSRAASWGVGIAAAGAVLALLAGTGTPVWSSAAHATLASSPTWKIRADQRAHADAVIAEHPGPGPVVLPPGESRALAISTTRVVAAVPRDYYVKFVQEPQADRDARFALRRFIDPLVRDPVPRVLARSLEALDVSLVCVRESARRQQHELRTIGLTGERRLLGLVCFDGPGTGAITPPAGRAPAR